MKNLFYPLIFATALVATACNNDLENSTDVIDPNGKTAISFSVEESQQPMTRAGFSVSTKMAMRIKSTDGTSSRYTRTIATANVQASGAEYSDITVDQAYIRYWDDAFGRKANLSVYAIAVPDRNDIDLESKLAKPEGSATWFTEDEENENVAWTVTTKEQNETTLAKEDLTYSRNIREGGEDGVYIYDFVSKKYPTYSTDLGDGCMKFRLQNDSETDGPGKFDKGHLIFKHALSRMTINLTKGDGYGDNAFSFAKETNVTIKGVPTSGTLNLATGEWTNKTNSDIAKMQIVSSVAHTSFSLKAQMLPDYVINKASTTNMLEFTIDDNKYFITQDQMFEALNKATKGKEYMTKLETDKVTMEQGVNYIFNITVGKTSIINVSATVVPFVEVEANVEDPSNARISLSLYSPTGEASTNFALYRALDESDVISDNYDSKKWGGNYGEKAALTADDSIWKTDWYFESNKTYYHFRIVNETTKIEEDKTDADDYFDISSGSAASTDPHWGAPMKSEPIYDESKGYENTLAHAIGASSDLIKITDLHVMSNIKVKLQTTTGGDKVTLAGSKVYITKLYKSGKVFMGNGLVTPTGSTGEVTMDGSSTEFTYAVVPQALVRGTADDDYVGITIVTGDNNQYYIVKKLSEITAKTVDNEKNQKTGEAITRWFPGHTYTYTFTLKKSGIDKITCTVQGWVDVTAGNKDITLED